MTQLLAVVLPQGGFCRVVLQNVKNVAMKQNHALPNKSYGFTTDLRYFGEGERGAFWCFILEALKGSPKGRHFACVLRGSLT